MDKEIKLKFINQTIRERKLLSAQKMRALKKVLLLLQRLNRKKWNKGDHFLWLRTRNNMMQLMKWKEFIVRKRNTSGLKKWVLWSRKYINKLNCIRGRSNNFIEKLIWWGKKSNSFVNRKNRPKKYWIVLLIISIC